MRTCSGVNMAVSTSNICSSRMKKLRHACSRLAFIAQPIGPKSYSPFTPANLYICLIFRNILEKRQGRQRKRWEDNIREWTGLEFGKSQRPVENRKKWRKLVEKSSVVPQPPSRLRDS